MTIIIYPDTIWKVTTNMNATRIVVSSWTLDLNMDMWLPPVTSLVLTSLMQNKFSVSLLCFPGCPSCSSRSASVLTVQGPCPTLRAWSTAREFLQSRITTEAGWGVGGVGAEMFKFKTDKYFQLTNSIIAWSSRKLNGFFYYIKISRSKLDKIETNSEDGWTLSFIKGLHVDGYIYFLNVYFQYLPFTK